MRAVSLILFLCTFWIVSSGSFAPILLGAMVASALGVTAFCARLRTIDAEGHPVHLLPRSLGFWLWLLPRIVRANLTVARLVFGRRAALAPRLVDVVCTQREDLGRRGHRFRTPEPRRVPRDVASDLDGQNALFHEPVHQRLHGRVGPAGFAVERVTHRPRRDGTRVRLPHGVHHLPLGLAQRRGRRAAFHGASLYYNSRRCQISYVRRRVHPAD